MSSWVNPKERAPWLATAPTDEIRESNAISEDWDPSPLSHVSVLKTDVDTESYEGRIAPQLKKATGEPLKDQRTGGGDQRFLINPQAKARPQATVPREPAPSVIPGEDHDLDAGINARNEGSDRIYAGYKPLSMTMASALAEIPGSPHTPAVASGAHEDLVKRLGTNPAMDTAEGLAHDDLLSVNLKQFRTMEKVLKGKI